MDDNFSGCLGSLVVVVEIFSTCLGRPKICQSPYLAYIQLFR